MIGRAGKIRVLLFVAAAVGCSSSKPAPASNDSAFAALQQRGESAMGVNQYTSQHIFEPLPDGGRVVLQRMENDPHGEATIRAHMRTIAAAFTRGDFALPGFVHATSEVPGTGVMTRLKQDITYSPRDLPGGGEVVISSKNPEAVAAIHEFLAFQRMDHRAGMH
ncbi:MAG TPA: hypothetical protein VHT23_12155 [Gemmatimonadaceae bacterium]|nr:hypothetical protein [Gemmatimonadaceae bacterium]